MSALEPVTIETPCDHAKAIRIRAVARPAEGCRDCLATGGHWMHLRTCLICGRVGCCDSSPGRHATKHYQTTRHPIMTSAEPGETWVWCYVDERELSG
jgi:uncharacterized UBP type Zn finger protein